MGKQASRLLREFETLPPADKQAVIVEILRRTREYPLDSGPLTDEEIGEADRSLFALLDQEENSSSKR
jgi:hypothetical protein